MTSPEGLHQLDAIPERVGDVDAVVAFDIVFDDIDLSLTKSRHQPWQVAHQQGGMRLPGGTKVRLNTKVNLDRAVFEPGTAARDERLKFRFDEDPSTAAMSGGLAPAAGLRGGWAIARAAISLQPLAEGMVDVLV